MQAKETKKNELQFTSTSYKMRIQISIVREYS